jgi:carbon-monoxide dehydrogenase small subunit
MKPKDSKTYPISITVNNVVYAIDVSANETLFEVLKDRLNFTSVKRGCDSGECGTCTVILERKAVYSCLLLAVEVDGKKILTLEGLSSNGELHLLQRAFLEHGAIQCGFCTPGMIMSAKAFLDENPNPTLDDIKDAMQGNLCRCTGYVKILEAVRSVAPRD